MENAKKFRSLGKFERHVACTDLIFGRVRVQRFYYVIHCSGAVFQPSAPSFRSVGMKKVPLHGVTLDDALPLVRWMAFIGSSKICRLGWTQSLRSTCDLVATRERVPWFGIGRPCL